jgi:putative oxygen-independent coproporphyrinogen III oxidase
MSMLAAPPLSLYVHMPWCVRKCPYCDFNSHTAPDRIPEAQYSDALLEDLEQDLPALAASPLVSIFFGGGTPSLFSPPAIGRLIEGVRERLPCSADLEVTLEANPGTIERGRFAGYKDAGVNRISLGVQSFDTDRLRVLGRIHDADDVRRAVDELAAAGLDNFNLDLMYGLPAQTCAAAVADVRSAVATGATHISHYQLTLEPGTVFYHRPPPLPDADATWEMQLECQAVLAQSGYRQYEVSAYARDGAQCRHNLNYWLFGDYLGIGAGAHGKLTLSEHGQIVRTTRCRQPRDYLSRTAAQRRGDPAAVAARDLPFEFMLNTLRLRDGFEETLFETRTGLPRETIARELSSAAQKGLLTKSAAEHWQPTELGRRFLNDLQALFLP